MAANILDGHGFSLSEDPPYQPSARRAPGYPMFLALVYAVLGRSDSDVLWAQSIVGGIGCLLVVRLVASVFDLYAGILSGLVVAAHPVFARLAGYSHTEALYTVFMIGLLLAFHSALRKSSLVLFALAGVLLGVATLIRPLTMAFLLFLWIGVWFWRHQLRFPVRSLLVMTALAIATILPWTIRNTIVFGRFIPMTVPAIGANLWQASLPFEDSPVYSWIITRTQPWREKYPEWQVEKLAEGETIDSVKYTILMLQHERDLLRLAIARIINNPVGYLKSRMRAYPHLWFYSGGSPWLARVSFGDAWRRGDFLRLTGKILFLAVFSLLPIVFAVYFLLSRGLRKEHYVLWAFPVFIALAHLPLSIVHRYGVPSEPFIWGLAVGGLRTLIQIPRPLHTPVELRNAPTSGSQPSRSTEPRAPTTTFSSHL
jgi:4-amino-4-deoxy-L-arabinose transferase-like glycosyltransferase